MCSAVFSFLSGARKQEKKRRAESRRVTLLLKLSKKTREISSDESFLSHRASGTNVAAIDNKIEQAMVSEYFTTDHTPL